MPAIMKLIIKDRSDM